MPMVAENIIEAFSFGPRPVRRFERCGVSASRSLVIGARTNGGVAYKGLRLDFLREPFSVLVGVLREWLPAAR